SRSGLSCSNPYLAIARPPRRAALRTIAAPPEKARLRPGESAVRQMRLREAQQEPVQLLALARVQRREELVLDALRESTHPFERLTAGRGDLDGLPATVRRVAPPLDESGFLEFVEKPDQLAFVVAECVSDLTLCLGDPLVEQGEDGVVVRM